VSVFTEIHLSCDYAGCWKEFQPDPEVVRGYPPGSVLRREAAKAGWTRVPSPVGRRFDRDYCTDHPVGRAPAGEGDGDG
jgi:hypothetical protein